MLIAELAQSHKGSMDLLKKMVDDVAECNIDAVKIQTFFTDDLSLGWLDQYDRMKELELSFEDHEEFVEICNERDLVPITSVYSTAYLETLKTIGFEYIKIGSPQCMNQDLILQCIQEFKVIVSTGGHLMSDLPPILSSCYAVLHCVSRYPQEYNQTNILRMLALKNRFPMPYIGYSNHCGDLIACELALACGAEVIEFHYSKAGIESKDSNVSLSFRSMKRLGAISTGNEKCSQFGEFVNTDLEAEFALINDYKGRWKSDTDICKTFKQASR